MGKYFLITDRIIFEFIKAIAEKPNRNQKEDNRKNETGAVRKCKMGIRFSIAITRERPQCPSASTTAFFSVFSTVF